MIKSTLPQRLQKHYDKIDFSGKGSIISKIKKYTKNKSVRVYSDIHNRTIQKELSSYDTVFYVNYIKNLS